LEKKHRLRSGHRRHLSRQGQGSSQVGTIRSTSPSWVLVATELGNGEFPIAIGSMYGILYANKHGVYWWDPCYLIYICIYANKNGVYWWDGAPYMAAPYGSVMGFRPRWVFQEKTVARRPRRFPSVRHVWEILMILMRPGPPERG
jgi:hypothetical protein